MNNNKPDKKAWADATKVILPTFQDGGTHVNISGVVLAKNAPNKANAMKFIEWLASEKAQHLHADLNYEYPVRAGDRSQSDHRRLRQAQCRYDPNLEDRRQQEGGGKPGGQGRIRQLI